MQIEPSGGWKTSSKLGGLVAPPAAEPDDACPCGEESRRASEGRHVLGSSCRALVVANVRRRFGAHRYGGRYASEIDDIVQDCYRKLWVPGGVDKFQPPADRSLAAAFRVWLFRVVENHCHNALAKLQRHLDPVPGPVSDDSRGAASSERLDVVDPGVAFARDWLEAIAQGAVRDVELRWRAKGATWAERFEVCLPMALELGGDYQHARCALGVQDNHARQLVYQLRLEIGRAARARVKDELRLEAGLSESKVEARIDEAIQEHFDAAFPGEQPSPWDALFKATPRPMELPPPEARDAKGERSEERLESKR